MVNIGGDLSTSDLTNVKEGDVQPNAVDLRLNKVFKIKPTVFEIGEDNHKIMREIEPVEPDADGYFNLQPGSYEVIMDNVIKVGSDEAGWVITRSTLNRSDIRLFSSLYDSGYHGLMAGCLQIGTGPARIQKGTRIGQYVSFKAQSLKQYDGSYGLNSEHDKKYNK
jgi:deoxycytidine triphosphate deaminase